VQKSRVQATANFVKYAVPALPSFSLESILVEGFKTLDGRKYCGTEFDWLLAAVIVAGEVPPAVLSQSRSYRVPPRLFPPSPANRLKRTISGGAVELDDSASLLRDNVPAVARSVQSLCVIYQLGTELFRRYSVPCSIVGGKVPISSSYKSTYTTDEGRIMEGQGVNGLIVGSSQIRPGQVPVKTNFSRSWTSIIECVSATGVALSPLVTFEAKSIQDQWFKDQFLEGTLSGKPPSPKMAGQATIWLWSGRKISSCRRQTPKSIRGALVDCRRPWFSYNRRIHDRTLSKRCPVAFLTDAYLSCYTAFGFGLLFEAEGSISSFRGQLRTPHQ
jgi:hypothetical protein